MILPALPGIPTIQLQNWLLLILSSGTQKKINYSDRSLQYNAEVEKIFVRTDLIIRRADMLSPHFTSTFQSMTTTVTVLQFIF